MSQKDIESGSGPYWLVNEKGRVCNADITVWSRVPDAEQRGAKSYRFIRTNGVYDPRETLQAVISFQNDPSMGDVVEFTEQLSDFKLFGGVDKGV